MKILVTGCAGFIGYHLTELLLLKKYKVFGIDNLNSYYDVKLKKNRLKKLKKDKNFVFYKIDINNNKKILENFKLNKYKVVINLAAQAGVRHSIKNPKDYMNSNVNGFFNILEASKIIKLNHLIYASSSSVYGDSKRFPLKEITNTDKPKSFYAATKKINEIMAYSYSVINKLPTTGLRFFTVYGNYGRPDMSLFLFTKAILEDRKINLHNFGNHIRDFTHVIDTVTYIAYLLDKPIKKGIPYQILNIGSERPKSLKYFLKIIEKKLSKKAKINFLDFQIGDVYKTYADNSLVKKITKYRPKIYIEKGINDFIEWYKNYYIK